MERMRGTDRTMRSRILWSIIILAACALRVFQLTFFEFKNDQLAAIALGHQARAAGFMVTHGMPSGVGVNNPPLFVWLMGSATAVTNDPLILTALVTLLNVVALGLAFRYFSRSLPAGQARVTAALLAVTPAGVFYSNILWAQCLLPPLMILFHIAFHRLITKGRPSAFVWMVLLATLASQLHLSGAVLFPILGIVTLRFRRMLRPAPLVISALLAALLSSPYLYHLFAEGELRRFVTGVRRAAGTPLWSMLLEQMRMSSIDFLRCYFREDFTEILRRAAGPAWFVAYGLSCALGAFWAAALLVYLFRAIRARALLDDSSEARAACPLPVQIAGFMTLAVTLGYLVLRVRTPPHYFIVLFPSYALLAGWAAHRVWQSAERFAGHRGAGFLVLLPLLATALLLFAVLLFLRRSGGHPAEYGPHYAQLLEWKADLWRQVPPGCAPSLTISRPRAGKFDTEAVGWILLDARSEPEKGTIPMTLTVNWDAFAMRYGTTLIRSPADRGLP